MTEEEQSQLIKLLEKLEPGLLPLDIFLQIARLSVLPIIEVVPLRRMEQTEILLLPRLATDKIWPNAMHIPGTEVRADDKGDFKAGFQRIQDELGSTQIGEPSFVRTMFHQSKRGWELAFIYWTEVTGEAHKGQFYKTSQLPASIIESQKEFIEEAVKSFEKSGFILR